METQEKQPQSLLKPDEIVEFINKLGYKIDKTIIESCDSDVIVELYSSIFEKLGILKKDKLKIRFEGMEKFSFPGMHDRPIYILKLFNSIKKFISDVLCIEGFTTSDLFTPNTKKTRKILSGIIKFYKFKQGEKDTYTTMKENLENSISQYKENMSKYERANSNYHKLK
jgi:hypothetical protein